MVSRTDYNELEVKAAYSVLMELIRLLGEYKENIVLVGGWVPQIIFQNVSKGTPKFPFLVYDMFMTCRVKPVLMPAQLVPILRGLA